MADREAEPTATWHTLTAEETLARLRSVVTGLEPDEATRRLERYGPNRLARVEPVPVYRVLLDQFASLVVVLLLAAAMVALALGDLLEAVAIGAVLLINGGIGFGVELRARRSMDALLRFEVPTAKVMRAGQVRLVDADRLVPGDVIRVEEGDAVPADARLLDASEVLVDEAPLTGESMPVDKDLDALSDAATPLAERSPMLYSGTSLTRGRASAVVVATGQATELGRIGTLVASVEAGETPLEVRLDELGRRLVGITVVTAAVVTALGVIRGASFGRMVETGIALAIAAVPEGLPAVATIALAVGLRRMARRHALVRRLAAVEALGSTTIVCTDKTGTLTAGEMTATVVATADRRVTVTGAGYRTEGELREDGRRIDTSDGWIGALLEACALTSRASLTGDAPIGDPTDAALLVLAVKGGVDPYALRTSRPEVEDVPFSSDRRWSATVRAVGTERHLLVKGAPDAVLGRSERWMSRDGPAPLTSEARAALSDCNDDLAARGLRVIALASGRAPRPRSLTLLGLVGIVDPPAEGVGETIQTLRAAGIRTVMVTGDQTPTASAIARDLGALEQHEGTLDGAALEALDDEGLRRRMATTGVYARVSPEQKVRIVSALQAGGDIVAMIGDGVNDAAALKKADIGVAMGGRGTDAAKQTAAIVLADDRFPTIGSADEEGRVIYENIRKFVFYLFSCNVAEVLVLLGAGIAGMPLPLLPLQILWLNLVTDTFPALALALEPSEPDVMTRPPRAPDEAILSRRFLTAMGVYAVLITGVTLIGYAVGSSTGDATGATTMAFMTLALAQLFHLGNARSRGPVVRPARAFANPWAVAAVPLVLALQVAAVHWAPLAAVLRTRPLHATEWLIVGLLAAVPATVGQLADSVQERRARRIG